MSKEEIKQGDMVKLVNGGSSIAFNTLRVDSPPGTLFVVDDKYVNSSDDIVKLRCKEGWFLVGTHLCQKASPQEVEQGGPYKKGDIVRVAPHVNFPNYCDSHGEGKNRRIVVLAGAVFPVVRCVSTRVLFSTDHLGYPQTWEIPIGLVRDTHLDQPFELTADGIFVPLADVTVFDTLGLPEVKAETDDLLSQFQHATLADATIGGFKIEPVNHALHFKRFYDSIRAKGDPISSKAKTKYEYKKITNNQWTWDEVIDLLNREGEEGWQMVVMQESVLILGRRVNQNAPKPKPAVEQKVAKPPKPVWNPAPGDVAEVVRNSNHAHRPDGDKDDFLNPGDKFVVDRVDGSELVYRVRFESMSGQMINWNRILIKDCVLYSRP